MSINPLISTGFSPEAETSSALIPPWDFGLSFNLMKIAARAGFITMATNRLEDSVTIRVIGKYFINSPMIPGQKIIGKKAARVVIVEPITG